MAAVAPMAVASSFFMVSAPYSVVKATRDGPWLFHGFPRITATSEPIFRDHVGTKTPLRIADRSGARAKGSPSNRVATPIGFEPTAYRLGICDLVIAFDVE